MGTLEACPTGWSESDCGAGGALEAALPATREARDLRGSDAMGRNRTCGPVLTLKSKESLLGALLKVEAEGGGMKVVVGVGSAPAVGAAGVSEAVEDDGTLVDEPTKLLDGSDMLLIEEVGGDTDRVEDIRRYTVWNQSAYRKAV